MKINAASFSLAGPKKGNQDYLMPAFEAGGFWWAAIADGMGGHPGGDVASKAAISAIESAIRANNETQISLLFALAHQKLKEISERRSEYAAMGTTLSLLRLSDSHASVGHVGDSRIYHLRGDGLLDRTVDQTEVEQLIQHGVLTKARARRYARRNVLLSVLSATKDYELYEESFQIKDGDRIILITDGVSSKVLRREIRDISIRSLGASDFCGSLAAEVEKRTPDDDFSAICIDIESV